MRLLAGAPASLEEKAEAADAAWAFVDAGPWLKGVLARLRAPETIDADRSSADLRATLRPYQETGVRWLRFLTSLGLGACLADDMGAAGAGTPAPAPS